MIHLQEIYFPLTAAPFQADDAYRELLPAVPLRPYIRCFWGTRPGLTGGGKERRLVTPDTCVDLIFYAAAGKAKNARFVGMSTQSFVLGHAGEAPAREALFGIRLFPWSAALLSDGGLCETADGMFDARQHYAGLLRRLLPALPEAGDLAQYAAAAQAVLGELLEGSAPQPDLGNALDWMVRTQGRWEIAALARELHLSSRQLERVFARGVGIAPKKMLRLVRYQEVWGEAVKSESWDVQTVVECCGYADQSHLLREFKTFHTMTPQEARRYARKMS